MYSLFLYDNFYFSKQYNQFNIILGIFFKYSPSSSSLSSDMPPSFKIYPSFY